MSPQLALAITTLKLVSNAGGNSPEFQGPSNDVAAPGQTAACRSCIPRSLWQSLVVTTLAFRQERILKHWLRPLHFRFTGTANPGKTVRDEAAETRKNVEVVGIGRRLIGRRNLLPKTSEGLIH